jgi:NADH-quinone oxidoreductase subunit J
MFFHGALLLITCLLALAGIYVIAFAEFVAVTQILVYAGGILVVIIFGIMLTTNLRENL